MLSDVIKSAQKGNKDAMMDLIHKFHPLLKKQSMKLQYEDAYEDCILFFIELMDGLQLERMRFRKDEVIVAYISTSVSNFCKKSARRQSEIKKEVVLSDLTEEQLYYTEVRLAKEDEPDAFLELGVKKLLSQREQQVIDLIYIKGYPISELARVFHKSRQAIN